MRLIHFAPGVASGIKKTLILLGYLVLSLGIPLSSYANSHTPEIKTLSPSSVELIQQYEEGLKYIPPTMSFPEKSVKSQAAFESVKASGPAESVLEIPPKKFPKATVHKHGKILAFLKPVQNAFISSPFGPRWGRVHQGLDMAAVAGTPILAAESGKVTFSGWQEDYGNFVVIDHGAGYVTRYAHSSRRLVENGQMVKKGQVIALVGNTGRSTGPHLHFEVADNGIRLDPAQFFNRTLDIHSAG